MWLGSKKYARALYETLRGKTEAETRKAIVKFVRDMENRGLIALLPNILDELPAAIKRADRIEDLLIESARDIDDQTVASVLRALGKKAEEVEVVRRSDPDLIGGIRVRGNTVLLDATIRGRLRKLRNSLAKPHN